MANNLLNFLVEGGGWPETNGDNNNIDLGRKSNIQVFLLYQATLGLSKKETLTKHCLVFLWLLVLFHLLILAREKKLGEGEEIDVRRSLKVVFSDSMSTYMVLDPAKS